MKPEIVGSRIKALLLLHNMKRVYLAKQMGISYNTLSKKLNGQREFSIQEMYKIKDIFNLDNDLCANIFFKEIYLMQI